MEQRTKILVDKWSNGLSATAASLIGICAGVKLGLPLIDAAWSGRGIPTQEIADLLRYAAPIYAGAVFVELKSMNYFEQADQRLKVLLSLKRY